MFEHFRGRKADKLGRLVYTWLRKFCKGTSDFKGFSIDLHRSWRRNPCMFKQNRPIKSKGVVRVGA